MTEIAANWSLPAGKLLLSADAPRDQWLTHRRQGLGSSDAALLMGLAVGDDSEYRLWLEKTGRIGEGSVNPAMQRGIWLEPHVADYFATKTGLVLRRCGLVAHRDNPILRATPDRLTNDGGLLEIKTVGVYSKVNSEWRHGIARNAWYQGQWQLMVTGREKIYFCSYTVDQEPVIRGPEPRDEALIDRMMSRAKFWWDSYVVADVPPPVDAATITDAEIVLRWPTAEKGKTVQAGWPAYLRRMLAERADLKTAEKTTGERLGEIDRALRAEMGDAESLQVGDRPVVTLKTFKNPTVTVNPKLEADHPDIWAQYVTRGTHRRIHVLRGWDNEAEAA